MYAVGLSCGHFEFTSQTKREQLSVLLLGPIASRKGMSDVAFAHSCTIITPRNGKKATSVIASGSSFVDRILCLFAGKSVKTMKSLKWSKNL